MKKWKRPGMSNDEGVPLTQVHDQSYSVNLRFKKFCWVICWRKAPAGPGERGSASSLPPKLLKSLLQCAWFSPKVDQELYSELWDSTHSEETGEKGESFPCFTENATCLGSQSHGRRQRGGWSCASRTRVMFGPGKERRLWALEKCCGAQPLRSCPARLRKPSLPR